MSRPKVYHSRPKLGVEEVIGVDRVIRSRHLAAGTENKKLRKELCRRYGREYAILTSSGVSALHLSLLALGCDNTRRVHVPSYVCSALLNAINYCGAKVEVQDVPHDDIFMSPKGEFLRDEKDMAIYVQMFGVTQQIDFPEGACLIEDSAMTLGKGACAQGAISVTSFYATKMMTTGHGGAILTDDRALHKEILDLMAYDNQESYRVRYNYDMSDVAAAMGLAQLKRLDDFIERRQTLARKYDEMIKARCPDLLAYPEGLAEKFPDAGLFRYWVKCKGLDEKVKALAEQNIESKRPVYRPLHRYLGLPDEDFPYATRAHDAVLSLPLYPELEDEAVDRVVGELEKLLA